MATLERHPITCHSAEVLGDVNGRGSFGWHPSTSLRRFSMDDALDRQMSSRSNSSASLHSVISLKSIKKRFSIGGAADHVPPLRSFEVHPCKDFFLGYVVVPVILELSCFNLLVSVYELKENFNSQMWIGVLCCAIELLAPVSGLIWLFSDDGEWTDRKKKKQFLLAKSTWGDGPSTVGRFFVQSTLISILNAFVGFCSQAHVAHGLGRNQYVKTLVVQYCLVVIMRLVLCQLSIKRIRFQERQVLLDMLAASGQGDFVRTVLENSNVTGASPLGAQETGTFRDSAPGSFSSRESSSADGWEEPDRNSWRTFTVSP